MADSDTITIVQADVDDEKSSPPEYVPLTEATITYDRFISAPSMDSAWLTTLLVLTFLLETASAILMMLLDNKTGPLTYPMLVPLTICAVTNVGITVFRCQKRDQSGLSLRIHWIKMGLLASGLTSALTAITWGDTFGAPSCCF